MPTTGQILKPLLTANCLLALRHERGMMSLRQLAQRAGVDKDAVNRMELGRDVHLSTACAVAIGLGCSLDELVPAPALCVGALAAEPEARPGKGAERGGNSVPGAAPAEARLDAIGEPSLIAVAAINAQGDLPDHKENPCP